VTKQAAILRLVFATCAILVSLVLSFRPIPDWNSFNDTGRYVSNQMQACALPASGSSSVIHDSSLVLYSSFANLSAAGDPSLTLSMRAWDWLNRPACLGGSPRIFLFYTAMAIPVGLLLFANWNREGTLLLACGLLISTLGFELMTNALRQGVSLAFLFGAFYFEKRLPKFGMIVIAALLHDSNLIFAPLAIMVAYGTTGTTKKKAIILWAIPALVVGSYLFIARLLAKYGQLLKAVQSYTEAYSDKPAPLFLVFMISPIIFVFLIRCLDHEGRATREEWMVFGYTMAILVVTTLVFPFITYRLAMTGAVLQVFMAMRASTLSVRSGMWISGGLVVHFVVYALVSVSVVTVFYG
jgi:hypothetical protein